MKRKKEAKKILERTCLRGDLIFILLIFSVLIMLFFSLVSADVISVNSGGDRGLIIGPDAYLEGFFSGYNIAPTVSNVILNSTLGTNKTTENLTIYYSSIDEDGDAVTNITDWRKDGQSIAVLNMPFDSDVSSTASGAIKDYSTFGNNGTLSGIPTWTSDGKVGGAYEFDGVNDYVDITDSESMRIMEAGDSATITFWAKGEASQPANADAMGTDSVNLDIGWKLNYNTNSVAWYLRNGTASVSIIKTIDTKEKWLYWTLVLDRSTETINIYVNGIGNTPVSTAGYGSFEKNLGLYIGMADTPIRSFNGSIDEVQIYNYSLSPEQINANYQAGLAGHSPETIVSQETAKADVWSVAVTPNDAIGDGDTVLSNTLTILNTLPEVVTLDSPEDGNITTDRTPEFKWNTGYDDDSDDLTYDLNLTCYPTCSVDNRLYESISEVSYTLTNYLKYLKDNGDYYNWTVRAHDGEGYGAWATPRKIEIQSLIDITLTNDTINFGSLAMDETNDTTDDNPLPFLLQNDGNCMLNISANATDLWTGAANPSDYFKYKIDNKSGEAGSFDWLQSKTSWGQMSNTAEIAIVEFNWSDTTDSAEIDLNVTVPLQEEAGNKESTVYFTASLGE